MGVTLTFDNRPTSGVTERVPEILARYGVSQVARALGFEQKESLDVRAA
jgi:hypothetical protein